MKAERLTGTIPASGIFSLGQSANFLLVVAASAVISIRLERGGIAEQFNGFIGGLKIRRVLPWAEARMLGAAGTTFEVLIGDQITDKDDTDVVTQIATIAGVAAVSVQPAVTLVSTAKATLATGNSLDVSANLSRKRISVHNESISLGSVWFRDQAATADAGVEIQPGTSREFSNTAAFRIRNNSGASANISFNEES